MTTREEAAAALEALYAQIPGLACKGLCADSCTVIDASPFERERIAERGVTIAPSADRAKLIRLVANGGDYVCPALSALGTCRVYDVRPLICRVYGVADGLLCRHGCLPPDRLTFEQVSAMLGEAHRISAEVDR